jgi:fructose 1,6-bisphosphate aldolase/phosphatase
MLVTLSAIKADVGSIGGHTRPTERMVAEVKRRLAAAVGDLLIDGMVTHTGDDIALLMTHKHGTGANAVHKFSWDCFMAATEIAREEGCYGAGQDLLVDAPSGNVRGAGPGVAEIEFERDPNSAERPAEAFLVFTADKCGPGAFNLPLYMAFCDPMHDGGLLLNPKMHKGFSLEVIDMDYKGDSGHGDKVIRLDVPERAWDVAALLQNIDRFAIEGVWSRHKPDEQVVSVSATRLHNIAGKYTGKDDPIAIVRTQGIFPAPEEVTEPFLITPFVTGDARGSHVMPLLPVPINSAVNGPYCHPICSGLALSMDAQGNFSRNVVDVFEGYAWDEARRRSQEKALEMRKQGFFGAAMAGVTEIAYTGLVDTHAALEAEFRIRADGVTPNGSKPLVGSTTGDREQGH